MTEVDPANEETFKVCTIQSDLRETCVPKERILKELERRQYGEEEKFAVKLALEEALSNAIKHGNRNDPSKKIKVGYAVTAKRAVIVVRDEGPGFCPDAVPDCTDPERLRLPNGRGIMLLRAYMDEVEYRDNGRELYIVKNFRKS